MTTAEAIERLEALAAAGWYWHAARGRLRPSEPLYGVGLYRPEDNGDRVEVVGEGETMAEAVASLEKELRKRVRH